jgi:hypothetical protein
MLALMKRPLLVASAALLLAPFATAIAQSVIFTEDFSDTTSGPQQILPPSLNTSEKWQPTTYWTAPVDDEWLFAGGAFLAKQPGPGGSALDQAIQLNESPSPALAVRIPGVAPVIGETEYQLQFDHWGDNFAGTYTILVRADTTLIQTVTRSFTIPGPGATTIFNFTAPSSSFVLSFQDASGSLPSGIIDNIILTAIPEPEIFGMMLAGFGLLGFVARRRTRLLRTA